MRLREFFKCLWPSFDSKLRSCGWAHIVPKTNSLELINPPLFSRETLLGCTPLNDLKSEISLSVMVPSILKMRIAMISSFKAVIVQLPSLLKAS